MGKRKTRSEKKIADLRRKLSESSPQIPQQAAIAKPNMPVPQRFSYSYAKTTNQHKTSSSQNYAYVIYDLRKTILFTAVILVFQCILFFLLKSHIVHFLVQY